MNAAALLGALALAAVAPCSAKKPVGDAYRSFAMEGGLFRCDVPKGWSLERDRAAEKAYKVYGVELVGPPSQEGAAARIRVHYFSKENAVFPDADAYVAANSRGGTVKSADALYGPVRVVTLR